MKKFLKIRARGQSFSIYRLEIFTEFFEIWLDDFAWWWFDKNTGGGDDLTKNTGGFAYISPWNNIFFPSIFISLSWVYM